MHLIKKKAKNTLSHIHQLTKQTVRAHFSFGEFKILTTCVVTRQQPAGYKLSLLHPGATHMMNREFLQYATIPLGADLMVWRKDLNSAKTQTRLEKRTFSMWEFDIEQLGSVAPLPEVGQFRCVIPITRRFEHEHYFNSNLFENDVTGGARGLLEPIIDNNAFHIYSIEFEKQHYLIIDGLQLMAATVFNEYCWTISVGLGFITGRLSLEEQYIFSFVTPEMDIPSGWTYERLRPSIDSIYSAIAQRPMSWLHPGGITKIEMIEEPNNGISAAVLGQLCSWIHMKDAHKAVALLIIEAKQATLLMRPAGFALALEGLATIFEQLYEDKAKPIKGKAKAKLLLMELRAIIDVHAGDEDFDIGVLHAKLNDLNKPTNRSRLKKPFEILAIPLTPMDEKALDYRNAILHGNVLLAPMDKKSFEMSEDELALRLLTLANAIILKLAGFTGWIINHPKMQLDELNEEHFRELGPQKNIDVKVFAQQ